MNTINEIEKDNVENTNNNLVKDQHDNKNISNINNNNEEKDKKKISYICSNDLIKYMSLLPSNKTRVK